MTPEEEEKAVRAARALTETDLRHLHRQSPGDFDEGAWAILDAEIRRRERVRDRIALSGHTEPEEGREGFWDRLGPMGWIGLLLLLGGGGLAVWALQMDISVSAEGLGRVSNLSLMSHRQTLLITGGFAAVVGAVLLGFDSRPQS